MHEIKLDLTPEQYEELEGVSEIMNRTVEETARLIVTVGAAYVTQSAQREAPDEVVSVLIHGLLQVPRVKPFSEDEMH